MPPARYKLAYLPVADADLGEIFAYIAEELAAPEAAERLLTKIDAAVTQLAIYPYTHPVYPAGIDTDPLEFRMLVIESWLILYYVTEDTVTIARVLHGRRDVREVLRRTAQP